MFTSRRLSWGRRRATLQIINACQRFRLIWLSAIQPSSELLSSDPVAWPQWRYTPSHLLSGQPRDSYASEIFISEQFTVKAHPALFKREGRGKKLRQKNQAKKLRNTFQRV